MVLPSGAKTTFSVGLQLFPPGDLPNADEAGLVTYSCSCGKRVRFGNSSAQQALAVGTEFQGVNLVGAHLDRWQFAPRGDLPDADAMLRSVSWFFRGLHCVRGQECAVGGNRENPVIRRERAQQLAGLPIVQPDVLLLSDGDRFTVGKNRHALKLIFRGVAETGQHLARGGFPDANRVAFLAGPGGDDDLAVG